MTTWSVRVPGAWTLSKELPLHGSQSVCSPWPFCYSFHFFSIHLTSSTIKCFRSWQWLHNEAWWCHEEEFAGQVNGGKRNQPDVVDCRISLRSRLITLWSSIITFVGPFSESIPFIFFALNSLKCFRCEEFWEKLGISLKWLFIYLVVSTQICERPPKLEVSAVTGMTPRTQVVFPKI